MAQSWSQPAEEPAQAEKPAFRLTEEQARVVDLVRNKESVAIRAFAGAGKTSTLKAAAEAILGDTPRRPIQYFAFNKAMAREAEEKFPASVRVSTAHALAYRSTLNGKPLGQSLRSRLLTGKELRDAVRDAFPAGIGALRNFGLTEYQAISDTLETVKHFCYSDADSVEMRHVPRERRDILKVTQGIDVAKQYVAYTHHVAKQIWERQADLKNTFPVTHDTYLKLWAMRGDFRNFDVVLFDEAQDANPVMISALKKMEQAGAQILLVGDTHQSIYGWRGAVDAMGQFPHFAQAHLTESFRFGQNIADHAQLFLEAGGETLKLVGRNPNPGVFRDGPLTLDVDPVFPDAILCRSNGGVIQAALGQIEDGNKPFVEGGAQDAAKLLMALRDLFYSKGDNRRKIFHPEIALFNDWDELEEFAESNEGGSYKPFVNITKKMVAQGTIEQAIHALQYETAESRAEADITISTAHKAKGLEWNNVQLGDDWEKSHLHVKEEYLDDNGEVQEAFRVNEENYKLLYVAVTRAKEAIDCSGHYDMWKQQAEAIRDFPITPEIQERIEDFKKMQSANSLLAVEQQQEQG